MVARLIFTLAGGYLILDIINTFVFKGTLPIPSVLTTILKLQQIGSTKKTTSLAKDPSSKEQAVNVLNVSDIAPVSFQTTSGLTLE